MNQKAAENRSQGRVTAIVRCASFSALRLLLALLLTLAGCESQQDPARELQNVHLDLPQLIPNASRADVIARADQLSVQANQQGGTIAAAQLEEAAHLRESAYLAFGKQVDALEAIELYSDAAGFDAERSCVLGMRMAALRAQLSHDPAAHFRELYVLKERLTESACTARVARGLAALSSYQPDNDSLNALRQQALQLRGVEGSADHHHHSERAVVVAPDVLRRSLDQPTRITKVEPYFAERTARIIIHVTHPTRFKVGTLDSAAGKGPRLFVDIEHATFEGVEPIGNANGIVEQIRLGSQKDASRIVLDLTRPLYHRVFYLPEPFRLVVDLSLESPEQSANPREIRRVVLDPGHGGHDPGAVGPNGLREKDVVLDVAHRAAPLLAREVGVSTLLTRDIDAYVPLDERSARANAFHADLFVSIHLNASPDSDSRGVMTFVLDASQDETASRIAARENASSEAAAAELANSLSRIESSERRAASEAFAQLLQRAAGASLRQKYDDVADHGVRSAGFYVLAGASMPAVLFEGSFISNPMEARRLNHEDYRQRLADAIVNAVRAYREGL